MVKSLLKAARAAIDEKNFDNAKSLSTQVLDQQPDNYNAYIFLGLAEQNLNNFHGSEAAYRKAITLNPSSPLALQGLVSLCETYQKWDQLAETFESFRELLSNTGDWNKWLDASLKLADVQESRQNDRVKAVETLYTVLKSDIGSAKEASFRYDTLKRMAALQEAHDSEFQRKEVETRRTRLGADSVAVIRQTVEKEMVLASKLDAIYDDIVALCAPTEVDEWQEKRLIFLSKKVAHVGADQKQSMWESIQNLASELVLKDARFGLPYEIVLDDQDVEAYEYNITILEKAINNLDGHYLHKLAASYVSWRSNTETFDVLELLTGVEQLQNSIFGHNVAMQVCLETKDYENALALSMKLENVVEENRSRTGHTLSRVLRSAKLCKATCYLNMGPKHLSQALSCYKTVLSEDSQSIVALQGLGSVLFQMGKLDEGARCFSKILSLDSENHLARAELGWIGFRQGDNDRALEYLKEALATHEDALYFHRVGCVYWAMGGQYRTDKQYAFANFIQAAKQNPNFAPAFTSLGDLYLEVEKDRTRAMKCYQKAFALDPKEEEAARHLSRMYLESGKVVESVAICKAVTSALPRTAWAWKQLGVVYLVEKTFVDAISCFQTALRIDAKDPQSWEGLAECYAHEGKYVAALKAFNRAIELDSALVYPRYQIARIKQKVGQYSEAISDYEEVLSLVADNTHIPTIEGLCESSLLQSKDCVEKGAYGQAAELLTVALVHLARAIERDFSAQSIFKIFGDVCAAFAKLSGFATLKIWSPLKAIWRAAVAKNMHQELIFPLFSEADGSTELDFPSDPSSPDWRNKSSETLSSFAGLGYRTALSLCESNMQSLRASYWHDLGLMYFYVSGLYEESSDIRLKLYQAGLRSVILGLRLNGLDDGIWNTFGVIALATSTSVSQHAFVRALELNSKNPYIWSNYGFMCMLENDLGLAQQAFTASQLTDPELGWSWLGLALVDEKWGKSETYDLYEHAYQLTEGSLPEINFRFALHHLKRAMTGHVDDASGFSTSVFSLQKYLELYPRDVSAANLLGVIFERQGRYDDAIMTYRRSMDVLTQNPIDTMPNPQTTDHLVMLSENCARCLLASGKFTECIEMYKRRLELRETWDDVWTPMGLGLAYYFAKQLEQSFSWFEKALHTSAEKSSAHQNHVVLLLSQVMFALGTEQHMSLCKEQLLQCIRNDSLNLPSILALCALGLVANDMNLAQGAAAELLKFPMASLKNEQGDIEWVLSRFFLLQNNLKVAKGMLSKVIHRNPAQAAHWTRLAEFLYRYTPSAYESCLRCAESAVSLLEGSAGSASSSQGTQDSDVFSTAAQLLSVAHLSVGGDVSVSVAGKRPGVLRRAISAIQRALHVSPQDLYGWMVLALSLRSELVVKLSRTADEGADGADHLQAIIKSCHKLLGILENVYQRVQTRLGSEGVMGVEALKLGKLLPWTLLLRCDVLLVESSVKSLASGASLGDATMVPSIEENLAKAEQAVKSCATEPHLTAAYMLTLGRALRLNGDVANAVLAFKQGAQAMPTWTLIWEELGEIYACERLYGAAELSYRQALAISFGGSAKVPRLLRLGRLALLLNNAALASEAVNEVFKIQSPFARIFQAALFLQGSGKQGIAKATKALQAVSSSGAGSDWAKYLLSRIDLMQ
ncbi:Superkiller protein 3 [Quaeritorhiza haematococci]|nr:Superkiller protein 3 [Quaeritorhiza haematococci]